MVVLKNSAHFERYVSAIPGKIEKVINSYDVSSRMSDTPCKHKTKHGESSVGKVAGLIHV
jgi:hypothetical protein